jgi:hypothetical protein
MDIFILMKILYNKGLPFERMDKKDEWQCHVWLPIKAISLTTYY